MIDLDVPEFFVTHIGKAERLGGNCIRMTMCVEHGDGLEPRYRTIWPVECLLSRNELIDLIGRDTLREVAPH